MKPAGSQKAKDASSGGLRKTRAVERLGPRSAYAIPSRRYRGGLTTRGRCCRGARSAQSRTGMAQEPRKPAPE